MNKNAFAMTALFLSTSSVTLLTIGTVSSYLRKQTMPAVILTVAAAEAALATAALFHVSFGKEKAPALPTPEADAGPENEDAAIIAQKKKRASKILKAISKKREPGTDYFFSFFESEKKESAPEA